MKTLITIFSLAFLFCVLNIQAQDVTTVEATDSDISENLDLEAIASIFGEAENLEDFEKMLNDPEKQISNLDLDGDGNVDYLRVIEASENETHLVTIQAVIGKDQYQDVATIDVEKDSSGETTVQVIGDVYMYGPDYIITPVYVHSPVIFVWFWGPHYHPWRSPYYWGYYPPYYHPWRPYPTPRYRTNVHIHVNVKNSYRRTTVRHSSTSVTLHKKSTRKDYAKKNPNQSFQKRNDGVKNKAELDNKRKAPSSVKSGNNKSTQQPVQKNWKPQSEREGDKSNVKNNKVAVPSQSKPSSSNSSTKPANQAKTKPTTKPSNSGTTKPTNKTPTSPSAKPSNNTSVKPTTKPASSPATKATTGSSGSSKAKSVKKTNIK